MFQFLKKQKTPEGYLIALSAEELLLPYQHTIEQIHQQIGVPESHWQAVYYQLIDNFAEQVQLLSASKSHHTQLGGLLSHSLEVALHALKFRKSKMLPLGAAVDVIEQQKELWSYAVFSAALLHDIGTIHSDQKIQYIQQTEKNNTKIWTPLTETLNKGTYYKISHRQQDPAQQHPIHQSITLLFASKLLPKSGLNWLASNANILTHWTNYLTNNQQEPNTLAEIITPADKLSTNSQTQPVQTVELENIKITQIENKTPKPAPKNIGKDFINWLTQGIADGSLPVNIQNALIHTIGKDKTLLLITPLLFGKYAKLKNTTQQQVQHDFQSLKLHKTSKTNKNIWKFEIMSKNKKGNTIKAMLIERAEDKLGIRLPPANTYLKSIK